WMVLGRESWIRSAFSYDARGVLQRRKAYERESPLNIQSALQRIDEVIAAGPYAPTWESLANYRVPAWYQDAKFGIFIHWGVYSVPAYQNEWYPRQMYIPGTREFNYHREVYGPHEEFGYKDFIPQFK